MKKFLVVAAMLWAGSAHANFDIRAAISRGSYIAPASVTGSSNTGTALFLPNLKRVDTLIFNNTSSTIWVGTATVAVPVGTAHPNVTYGIPVLSSTSLSMDGLMSDGLYFTCNAGATTCEARVFQGLVQ